MITTSIILLSRLLCVVIWAWGLGALWKHRNCDHANQALAGALSMIAIQGLLVFNVALGYTYLFLPLSHLVLASSLTKMFKAYHHLKEVQDEEVEDEETKEMVKTFSKSTLMIASVGVLAFLVQMIA